VYVANLEGLNAAQTSDFRRQAFKNNIKLKVVKNTLLQKAMEQIEGVDYSEMFPTFKGNTAVMIAETANAPAKLIQGFRKKEAFPALKSAYLQETFYVGDNNLDTLANIKSREEMIGEIIGLLQSPIQRLISALENKEEAKGAKTEEAPAVEAAPEVEAPATEETPEAPAAEGEAPAAE
jgi:large subunit ribosomal protein L10